MTGAVTVSAVVGMLSLVVGFALGWYSRRASDCPACGEQLDCDNCKVNVPWPEEQTSAVHH